MLIQAFFSSIKRFNELTKVLQKMKNNDSQIVLPSLLKHFIKNIRESDRQWCEALYFDKSFTPIGKIKIIISFGPNDENSLLDACIIFAPKYFESCTSLKEIQTELKDAERLDFDLGEIPKMWDSLRRKARPMFEKLNLFKIKLVPLAADQRYHHYRE